MVRLSFSVYFAQHFPTRKSSSLIRFHSRLLLIFHTCVVDICRQAIVMTLSSKHRTCVDADLSANKKYHSSTRNPYA